MDFFGQDDGVADLRSGKKPLSLDVATLVWQKWSVEAISAQLGIPVEKLEREYEDELAHGASIVEGRVACELVKRALKGDDKSLHLLAKSKFGFNEPKEAPVAVNVGVGVNLSPEGENALVAAVRGLEEKGAVVLEAASVPKAAKAARKPAPKGGSSSPKRAKEVSEQEVADFFASLGNGGLVETPPDPLVRSLRHKL